MLPSMLGGKDFDMRTIIGMSFTEAPEVAVYKNCSFYDCEPPEGSLMITCSQEQWWQCDNCPGGCKTTTKLIEVDCEPDWVLVPANRWTCRECSRACERYCATGQMPLGCPEAYPDCWQTVPDPEFNALIAAYYARQKLVNNDEFEQWVLSKQEDHRVVYEMYRALLGKPEMI